MAHYPVVNRHARFLPELPVFRPLADDAQAPQAPVLFAREAKYLALGLVSDINGRMIIAGHPVALHGGHAGPLRMPMPRGHYPVGIPMPEGLEQRAAAMPEDIPRRLREALAQHRVEVAGRQGHFGDFAHAMAEMHRRRPDFNEGVLDVLRAQLRNPNPVLPPVPVALPPVPPYIPPVPWAQMLDGNAPGPMLFDPLNDIDMRLDPVPPLPALHF